MCQRLLTLTHTTKLTHDKLLRMLDYSPETGEFTWKQNRNRSAMKGMKAGTINKTTGYVYIRIDGYTHAAHNLAWFYVTKEWPIEIDHDNRIRHDNRWANLINGTRVDNMRNHSRTTLVEIDGEEKSVRQWCIQFGLKPNTVYKRIHDGMSPKQALGAQ